MRLIPQLALPPYTYVSGRWPHPLREPTGHQFLHQSVDDLPLEPVAWRDCPAYLYAIDLFNAGYYWEAHEQWERCWHHCARPSSLDRFLRALIKLAAAGVKAREGRSEGVRRHATRSASLLAELMEPMSRSTYAGLNLLWLSERVGEVAEESEDLVRMEEGSRSDPVVIVFRFQLQPADSE